MRAHAPTARRGVPTRDTRPRLRDRGRSLRLQARQAQIFTNHWQATRAEIQGCDRGRCRDGASRDRSECRETSSRWGRYACGLNSSAGLSFGLGSRAALAAFEVYLGVLPEGARVPFVRLEAPNSVPHTIATDALGAAHPSCVLHPVGLS